jgi:hypothetical protein
MSTVLKIFHYGQLNHFFSHRVNFYTYTTLP